jgi:hypothetical protein
VLRVRKLKGWLRGAWRKFSERIFIGGGTCVS